jgi:tetratricopeptide (TPR) repeat protein
MGDFTGAMVELEKLAKFVPHNAEISARFAALYLKTERYPEAMKHAKAALEWDPENIQALRIEGSVERIQGNDGKAQKIFEKLLSLDPGNYGFHLDLADIHFKRKEYKEAEDRIIAFLARRPNDRGGKLLLGKLYTEMGNRAQAIQIFEDLAKADPNDTEALSAAAELHKEAGSLEKALRTADQVVNLQGKRATPDDLSDLNKSLEFYENTVNAYSSLVREMWERNIKLMSEAVEAEEQHSEETSPLLGTVEAIPVVDESIETLFIEDVEIPPEEDDDAELSPADTIPPDEEPLPDISLDSLVIPGDEPAGPAYVDEAPMRDKSPAPPQEPFPSQYPSPYYPLSSQAPLPPPQSSLPTTPLPQPLPPASPQAPQQPPPPRYPVPPVYPPPHYPPPRPPNSPRKPLPEEALFEEFSEDIVPEIPEEEGAEEAPAEIAGEEVPETAFGEPLPEEAAFGEEDPELIAGGDGVPKEVPPVQTIPTERMPGLGLPSGPNKPEGSLPPEKPKMLGLIQYLRSLAESLPKEKRDTFMKSDARLGMEYIIDTLEGRKGLFRGIQERVPVALSPPKQQRETADVPKPKDVTNTLAYLGKLASALSDQHLSAAITRKVDTVIMDMLQSTPEIQNEDPLCTKI